jgi:hypothetical protein
MREAKTLQQAIDAAWRRIKRSTAPAITLSPFIDRAMAQSGQCSDVTAAYIRDELAARLARYRPRPRGRVQRASTTTVEANHAPSNERNPP